MLDSVVVVAAAGPLWVACRTDGKLACILDGMYFGCRVFWMSCVLDVMCFGCHLFLGVLCFGCHVFSMSCT